MAAGGNHSLVIAADGSVWGAGSSYSRQLTVPGMNHPALGRLVGLPAGVRATAVAGGSHHSLVLADDGRVYGAGRNAVGQLTGAPHRVAVLTPVAGLPTGVAATQVAAGYKHSLVIGGDGVVYGTGGNGNGQLTGTGGSRTLTPLSGLPAGVSAIAVAGSSCSLVLGDDGVAYGTGLNNYGQLTGDDPWIRTLTPLAGLPDGVQAVGVAAGYSHALVLGDDGVAYGAGGNYSGQLTGTGGRRILAPLTGLPVGVRAVAVSTSGDHSLVLGDDGSVYGAGNNRHGQLTGSQKPVRTLTELTGLPHGVGATAVAAGGHSLVLADDGRVYGTGYNSSGQLTGRASSKHTLTPFVWAIVTTVAPRLVGAPRVGSTLTARHGHWTPRPTSYSYVWFRNGQVIPGATSSTHRLVRADLGKRIKVRVVAHHPGCLPTRFTPPPVGPVG